jgi:hypothetical protein
MVAGLWTRKRRACFGELIQFDGSQRTKVRHDWFEGRRGKYRLMNMVDDATGTTRSLLYEQETTGTAMEVLSY